MKKILSFFQNNWLSALVVVVVGLVAYRLHRVMGAPGRALQAVERTTMDLTKQANKEPFGIANNMMLAFGLAGSPHMTAMALANKIAGGKSLEKKPELPSGRVMSPDAKKALAQPIPKPKTGVPLVKSTPAKNAAVSKGWYGTPVGGSVFGPKKF